MKTLRYFILNICGLGILSISCAQEVNTIPLVIDNKSAYIILTEDVDSLDSPVKDLQKYIYEISKVKLPILFGESKAEKRIIIRLIRDVENERIKAEWSKLKPGGFLIKTNDNDIIITGKDFKGVSNGIYTFLEKYLGCRYYAKNVIKIPKRNTILLDQVSDLQNPSFQLSILHSYEAFSAEYCRWHKLDVPPKVNSSWMAPWLHSTTTYVDPNEYFVSHPEYFMLYDGRRNQTELNFSNSEVRELIVSKIENRLDGGSEINYIGVSQADGNRIGICRCASCQRIVREGGAPSAVLLELVNHVARQFPDMIITTLAYQYSQQPPKSSRFKPAENVLILLCNTELNRVKATSLKTGNSFLNDLQKWQELTKNIMIWDYVANTYYPSTPYPNLYLLQKNIVAFKKLGISKIFEQSNSQKGSEFQELRSYLIAKLLWNPDTDIDSVLNDFLSGYYGPAAPHIRKYIDEMVNAFEAAKKPLRRNSGPIRYANGYLSRTLIEKYETYFENAENAVRDNRLFLQRVDKEKQALRFAKLEIYKSDFTNNRDMPRKGLLTQSSISMIEYRKLMVEFVTKAEKYGTTRTNPGIPSPKTYMKSLEKELEIQ